MPRAMAVTNTVFNRPTKGRAVMGLRRTQPEGWDHVFEAEDASKEEAEDGGAESTAGNDGRQIQLLKPVKKETADKEQKPLSHVSEHEAEKEGIGDGDQKCRIKFIVGREAIHLHKHLKGPQERRILQPGRRRAGYMLPAVLDDEEGGGVLLQLLLEGPGVGLSGPAA